MDLISDPVSTVETVYRHFGMTLSPQTSVEIDRYVAARPKGGYGEHRYHFEDHGLDEQQERARFRPYMVQFGVAPEAAPRPRTDKAPADLRANDARTLQS